MSSIQSILDFAKRLEADECGNVPMWRRTWVIPADATKGNKKDYCFTEYPSMTAEEIANSSKLNKKGDRTIPGRGYEKKPNYINQREGGDCAYPSITMYIKRIPDMFVIDLDEKSKCNENNPLYTMLLESGCPYTITAKGYHFYIYVDGTPAFTASLSVQKVLNPIDPTDETDTGTIGAMDFLGRKHPTAFNPVEACHSELVNGDAPFPHYDWEDFSKKFLDVPKMMGAKRGKKDNISRKEKREAVAVSGAEEGNIDAELFQQYLDRLDCSEGSKRYKYDPWIHTGIVCWNNFSGSDEGFTKWMMWAHKDILYKKTADGEMNEHSYRDLSEHKKRWDGFHARDTPMTWKTLRGWANEDDGGKNIFQEVYDARGEKGLCDYMNEFICFNRKTSEIIFNDPDDRSEYSKVEIKPVKDMKPLYESRMIKVPNPTSEDGKKKMVNPFSLWMKCFYRRDVCGITFDPSPSCPTNYYNMYDGFNIDQRDVVDWTKAEAEQECQGLLDHIYNIWCHGIEEHYKFVIGWFAHILQRPHIKVGVLICVKSKEGGGKGIVFDFMRTILGGRLYKQIHDIQHITGQWNSVLEGRLLINGDEVVWGGDVVKGNTLKGLITEPEVTINEKFRQSYSIKNTTAFCMSSNEERCMSSREGDRRSFGLELDNRWCGKQKSPEHKQYFGNISGAHNSSAGTARKKAEAFAKYLFEFDLSGFNPANAPLTEFVSGQIMKNWHPVEKWWFRVLQTGMLDIQQSHKKETIETYQENDFEKQRRIPYDDAQLIYGNVSKKWGNGEKCWTTKMSRDMDRPLQSCPYYYSTTNMGRGEYGINWMCQGSTDLWHKWEKICEKYDIDILKVPMPYELVKVDGWGEKEGGGKASWKPSHPNRYEKEGWVAGEGNHSFDILCGIPKSACMTAEGIAPNLCCETNKHNEELFRSGLHCSSCPAQLDWQMDMKNPYKSVADRMEQKVPVSDDDVKYGKKHYAFHHSHMHYYRKGCKDAFELIEKPSAYPNERPDTRFWEIAVVDEPVFLAYCEKWKDGVNEDNFHEDLYIQNWFDTKGCPLFHQKSTDKITKWLYNKDWVFEKFQQQVGIGYGGHNIDQNTFWSRVQEMLGGKREDGKGGLYQSLRARTGEGSNSRKQFLRFVAIEPARERFSQWAGRLVDWDDSSFAEDVDDTIDEDFGY